MAEDVDVAPRTDLQGTLVVCLGCGSSVAWLNNEYVESAAGGAELAKEEARGRKLLANIPLASASLKACGCAKRVA